MLYILYKSVACCSHSYWKEMLDLNSMFMKMRLESFFDKFSPSGFPEFQTKKSP